MICKTITRPTHMTRLSVMATLLSLWTVSAHADLIAYTSFEEPGVFPGVQYIDTGDPTADHLLINNPGQPLVNWIQTGPASELGFSSVYSNMRRSVGLTDGDFVGVTNATSLFPAYPSGSQGFQMSDTDGLMTTTLAPVALGDFLSPIASARIFIASTGWEADDHIRVWTTVDGGIEIDLLDTQGQDIDSLGIEDSWITLSADLTGYTMATLAFQANNNSGPESIFVDDIQFNGTAVTAPVPVPGAFILATLGLSVAIWKKKE